MRFGVVVFPGSNCEADTFYALQEVLGQKVRYLWHRSADLEGVDAVILPGGFTYGDYLRPGALARFAPIMASVAEFAAKGGPVLGICNGFQVLTEAGLLPGALRRNRDLRFHCETVRIRVESEKSLFTAGLGGRVLEMPIAHGEGNYYVDVAELERLEERGQVIFRYVDAAGKPGPAANPNGSIANIAGVANERGNVLGMMPHPERAVEALLGGTDGRRLFEALMGSFAEGRVLGAGA